jgi:hypothetical protein
MELQVQSHMFSCYNAELGTGTALMSQLTEPVVLFGSLITVLQLATTQKEFKSRGRMCLKYIFALLKILCNVVSLDD